MQRIGVLCLTLGCLLVLQACNGTTSGSGASAEINNLSDIPSLNLKDYDYSDDASESAKLAFKGAVGENSRAGCEAHALFGEATRHSQNVENFMCYIRSIHEYTSGQVDFADTGFNYYRLTFSDEEPAENEQQEGPPPVVYVRLGRDGNEVTMDVCQGDPLSRSIELRLNADGEAITGSINERHQGFDDFGPEPVEVDETMSMTVSLTPNADGELVGEFNVEFSGSFGSGILNATADPATKTNTVNGAHSFDDENFGTFDNAMAAAWTTYSTGTTSGSARAEISASFPAPTLQQCIEWGIPEEEAALYCADICYDHEGNQTAAVDGMCPFSDSISQSFDIDAANFPPDFTIISTSEHENMIAETTLLDADSADPGFDTTWDCTAGDGDFVAVDLTAADFSSCEEGNRDFDELHGICHEREQVENGQDGP